MDNLYNFEAKFRIFLNNQGVSSSTCRNYATDVRIFASWLSEQAISKESAVSSLYNGENTISPPFSPPDPTDTEAFNQPTPRITLKVLKNYQEFLKTKEVSLATRARRLAGLRKFLLFLKDESVLSSDETDLLTLALNNKQPQMSFDVSESRLVWDFVQFLSTQGLNDSSIRNYQGDVEQFFSWLQTNTDQ